MHNDFPVSIDLAIDVPDMKGPGKMQAKSEPMYPSLFISGAKSLEDLPREGYALIHFKRRSITMGERDGEDCCSADLEIHEIRLPEKGSDEDMGDIGEALTSMAKKRGLMGGEDEEMEESDESEEGESLAGAMEDEDEEE
jgi:hypothetical protein